MNVDDKGDEEKEQVKEEHERERTMQADLPAIHPQRTLSPNPQDVNKAASIASERALMDAKEAISMRLQFNKEGKGGDKKEFFRTAKDVLETLMPFHTFADQRGLFQFDSSSFIDEDDESDNNGNKKEKRKKLRLLREAVGMLIAEKEGFAIEDDNDEREEEKRSENKLENKDEDEQKVKRRRPSEACALLTEENVLHSGMALRVNKIDDDMLKDLRTLHKGLEACEQSCMPLQRHSDEDSTSANVLSQAEEFLIERLVSEETRIALDFKSSELRKIAQEERQKVADMRRAEAAFALASKAAAAAQQQLQQQQHQQ